MWVSSCAVSLQWRELWTFRGLVATVRVMQTWRWCGGQRGKSIIGIWCEIWKKRKVVERQLLLREREGSGQTGAFLNTKWFTSSRTNTLLTPLSCLAATHICIRMDRQGSTHAVCFLAHLKPPEQKAFQKLKHLWTYVGGWVCTCTHTDTDVYSQSSPSVTGVIHHL